MKTMPRILCVWIWAACACCAVAAPLDEARAKWAEYESAQRAQEEARNQGNAGAAQEQVEKARQALSGAVALYQKAGAAASKDLSVRQEYTKALRIRGDFDWAAEVLKGSVALEPSNASLWREYGEALFRGTTELRRQAGPAFQKALELDGTAPEAVRSHTDLGDVYFDQALYPFARQHYEAALALQADYTPARIGRALMILQAGNLLQGSQELDALGGAAKDFDTLVRTRLRRILADFDRSGRLEDTVENHQAYCRLAYRAGRPVDALLAAERVLKLDPANVDTLNFVGAVCGQVGNLAQARSAYAKSLEIKPDQPHVRETLQELDKAIAASKPPVP